MKTKMILAAAATALLATAAAPLGLAADKAKAAKSDNRQCFQSRAINSFAAPDNKTLYVRVGTKDVYRLDMFSACQDMNWNEHIAIQSRGSTWICSGLDAEVISRTAIGPERCLVNDIHKLTPAEIAALPPRAKP